MPTKILINGCWHVQLGRLPQELMQIVFSLGCLANIIVTRIGGQSPLHQWFVRDPNYHSWWGFGNARVGQAKGWTMPKHHIQMQCWLYVWNKMGWQLAMEMCLISFQGIQRMHTYPTMVHWCRWIIVLFGRGGSEKVKK